MGRGLGSASQASRHLGGLEASTYELTENQPSKLQSETGLVGVVLFYVFVSLLLLRWFNLWLKTMDDRVYDTGVALSAYCFIQFTVAGVFFILDSPPVPIFLWTIVGMVARLSTLTFESPDYGVAPREGHAV